jgi:hypothetical protein
MPALTMQLEACVLSRGTGGEKCDTLKLYSADHGPLTAYHRRIKKEGGGSADLFDDISCTLTSSNQGRTWFTKEVLVLRRRAGLGASYETLSYASRLATLVARNPVTEESRADVALLLRQALDSLVAGTHPPGLIYLKGLYRFALEEGYPVKQHWLQDMHASLRVLAGSLLHSPLAAIDASKLEMASLETLIHRLEEYLRGHTELSL